MNRDTNVREEWTDAEGHKLRLPFKCDAGCGEDAEYGYDGRLLCTTCHQLQAKSGQIPVRIKGQ